VDVAKIMTAGLLINPRSGNGNPKGIELAKRLEGFSDVTVSMLKSFSDIAAQLEDFAQDGITDLFISSGDGTIQEVQTLLAERKLFERPPRLCLLPHGTTNMTAADLGFRTRGLAAQAEFIRKLAVTHTVRRPTLRIANPRDRRPRHGMFLGAGAVAQASRFCQEAVHKSGLKGGMATFATLAASVVRALASRPAPDDPNRIDRPHPIDIRADGVPLTSGNHLLIMLTTLEKLILGTKPFWGGQTAPLRGSVFPYPVPSVVRWLLPSMYGSENRTPPPGAISFSCRTCEITTPSYFIIDGEFFDPPECEPLRVETGPEFTYIRG
jgi:diacylglycerol kinase family enzyme